MRRNGVRPATLLEGPGVLECGLRCERWPSWGGRVDDRIDAIPRVNLVQELGPYDGWDMDWYGGGPPQWTLALCVLDRLAPPKPREQVEINGWPIHCSAVAVRLHRAMAAELLDVIPYWGGAIQLAVLRDWVARMEVIPDADWIDLTMGRTMAAWVVTMIVSGEVRDVHVEAATAQEAQHLASRILRDRLGAGAYASRVLVRRVPPGEVMS
jgi:hypothetical protein